jgi:hypothetical protein
VTGKNYRKYHSKYLTHEFRIQPGISKVGSRNDNYSLAAFCFQIVVTFIDRLCGLVVKVSGYRSRDPTFDFRCYQIFLDVVGLKLAPFSLVRINDELLEWKLAAVGLENRD